MSDAAAEASLASKLAFPPSALLALCAVSHLALTTRDRLEPAADLECPIPTLKWCVGTGCGRRSMQCCMRLHSSTALDIDGGQFFTVVQGHAFQGVFFASAASARDRQ